MSVRRFCVNLDNRTGVYFPGQAVSGKVDFWISRKKKIRGIHLEAKGESIVHWTETKTRTEGSGDDQRQVTDSESYISVENYFRHFFPFLQRGGESFDLVPGNYEYLFRFQLPNQIPSSFEGGYGWVRYTLKVIVARQWKSNYEIKVPFTVNTIVDLNTIETADQGIQGTDTKTLRCLCCTSGPVTAKAWLDFTGYVPGQKIMFNAEIDNKSRKSMAGTKVQLIQHCSFRAQSSTNSLSRVLYKEKRGRFGTTESWSRVPISVPSVVPSIMPFCNHISVDYYILFTVKTEKFSSNMRIPLNIMIGNIPLRQFFAEFSAPSASPVERSLSAVPQELDAENYPDLRILTIDLFLAGVTYLFQKIFTAPPAYEETMFAANIREEGDSEYVNYGGTMQFAPRYLTYRTLG